MQFSETLACLNKGETLAREAWVGGTFIVKQIPQTVVAEIVPHMTSLPEQAKKILCGTISYHDQVLLVQARDYGREAHATYYMPSWEDIFADDWRIINP